MKPSTLHAALLAPAVLLAQAPEPTLTQRLRSERPEIERLIRELQARDALKRAEALLPAAKPSFDNSNIQTQVGSFSKFGELAQAHYLAFKAADAAGYWEKALDYIKQAKSLAVENYAAVKDPFTKASEAYLHLAQKTRASAQHTREMLKENELYIMTLREKKEKDESDKQQLDLVAKEEKNLPETDKKAEEAEKWAKQFQAFLDSAKQDAERYEPFVAAEEKRIKDQEAQIEEYKFGRGDKRKWVEAIAANPSTYAALTEKQDQIAFFYRLNVLDPDNKKVNHHIEVLLGKAAPEKKAVKPKKRR